MKHVLDLILCLILFPSERRSCGRNPNFVLRTLTKAGLQFPIFDGRLHPKAGDFVLDCSSQAFRNLPIRSEEVVEKWKVWSKTGLMRQVLITRFIRVTTVVVVHTVTGLLDQGEMSSDWRTTRIAAVPSGSRNPPTLNFRSTITSSILCWMLMENLIRADAIHYLARHPTPC